MTHDKLLSDLLQIPESFALVVDTTLSPALQMLPTAVINAITAGAQAEVARYVIYTIHSLAMISDVVALDFEQDGRMFVRFTLCYYVYFPFRLMASEQRIPCRVEVL